MALEIVYGLSRDRTLARLLVDALSTEQAGTLYLGYPVLASADDRLQVDALLVSPIRGVVALVLATEPAPDPSDIQRWQGLQDAQDRLYFMLETHLARHEALRRKRQLAVPIAVVTVFSDLPEPPESAEGHFAALPDLVTKLPVQEALEDDLYRQLQAALQRIVSIKPPKKRASVVHQHSRGAILRTIEKEIANLDRWQKRAAIETPEGPQRIRGLAGSGKTVVLALKAAYLHSQYPDWRIAMTFQTRALYQQILDLIRRFSFEHTGDEPDWSRLQVLHAWGGRDRDGVYTQLARHLGAVPRDFVYARGTYGMEEAFGGVCNELLAAVPSSPESLYDVVLVDEAQDLPSSFFRLVYRFIAPPKRIVWAYDELQKLSETAMPSMVDFFGKDDNGRPLVQLMNPPNGPRQDVILPVCYRNTPWALTVAHSLGLGLERERGPVQQFDDPALWQEIGYEVVSGSLTHGADVTLQRARESYPEYFDRLLQPDDALAVHQFETEAAQAEWLAANIETNLRQDELEHDDILVVLPSAYTAKSETMPLAAALARRGINCHLAGVTSSRDELFVSNSIAMAHIFRSKGNEAPMVYVINAHHASFGVDLITRRNTLFTAITRSRAWVRICGVGDGMAPIAREVQAVQQRAYRLKFRIPNAQELAQIRQIHRERSEQEIAKAKKATDGLVTFLEALRRGEISLDNLPAEVRTRLALALDEDRGSSDDEDAE